MRAFALLAGIALLTACGHEHALGTQSQSQPSPPARALMVATGNSSGNQLGAALAGVLHGRVNADQTACFWIEPPPKQGQAPSRIALMWPHGTYALPNPLRVVNPEDHLVASLGQDVTLAGGFLDPGQTPLKGCPDFQEAFGG